MKIHGLRWWIAGLLFAASVINYIDRQTLSLLAPLMQKELGISDQRYAFILQAFLFAYTAMYLISGPVVDRLGARLGLGLSIIWWSLAEMLHAFVASALGLGVCRFLLGVGEPGNYTAATKATAEWFPAKEKAFVVGLYTAGGTLGATLAPPLIALLALRFGWRMTFVITGALGLAWVAAWLAIYRSPLKSRWLTDGERDYLRGTGVMASAGVADPVLPAPISWHRLFAYREIWLMLLARLVTDPVWYFYLFWFPKYLVAERGFTIAQVGARSWVVFLAADIGCLLGGWFSGALIRRGNEPAAARRSVMYCCAAILPLNVFIPFVASGNTALLLASCVTFAHMAWLVNLGTLVIDLFPPRVVGSAQGILGAGSGMGGFLSTALIGWAVQHISYHPVFIGFTFIHPIAAVTFLSIKWRKNLLSQFTEE